jgi:diguanylate cyclase (GGDEF)-like protein
MDILFILIIVILVVLLLHSYRKTSAVIKEKEQLIHARDTALEIANKVVNTQDPTDLYQYILESCLKLIPKAKFGSILMFNSDGLLAARASVGFNLNEISKFRLKLEEVFLYIATGGKMDQTVIINRIEDLVKKENVVTSGDQGFAIRSEVSSPLYINGELVGVLCVDGDENDIFTEQDIYTLNYMSNQISIVINNQKLYSKILHLSRYDSMTQMLNRDSFEQAVEKLLIDPSKDAPNLYFVLMDLDGLKAANDTYGHQFGDEILKGFSEIIRKYLNRNDLCGRCGGDEFAAVIQGDHFHVSHMLEEARTELMEFKGRFSNPDFIPSFSYGKASFIEGNGSLDSLYKLADSSMYQSKKIRKSEKK